MRDFLIATWQPQTNSIPKQNLAKFNFSHKMPKIVDLRQDSKFIRKNFDGYKLSLEPLPLIRQELIVPPQKATASEEQYSLLHAELFSLQNLLHADPWERNTTYYVNVLGEIVRGAYDVNSGRPQELGVVFKMEDGMENSKINRIQGDYNYSFRFISEKYCVLCNGINRLLLLDTGDRLKAVPWKQAAATSICANDEKRNFIIYDCRLDIIKEQKKISCALGHVSRLESADINSSIHVLQLYLAKWFQDVESGGDWQFRIGNILQGRGSLYYCAFEPKAECLVISSNREFSFQAQLNPSTVGEQNTCVQLHDETVEVSGFTWSQSDDDLVMKFDSREGKTKADYTIKCTTQRLSVKCDEELVLDRALFESVDADLTTWSFENNFLQVTLVKSRPGMLWPAVLAAGIGPKESSDENNSTSLFNNHKPVVNLEAPVEDCDFPISGMDDDNKILRIDIGSKKVTHSIFLGSTQPLFSTTLRPGFPAAIATRQDVDASLWLQQCNPNKPEEWSLRHEGNLHAFGYIQASKQQKKFMDCAPDLSYSLICESHRHLFLYRSNNDSASGLRNRAGPQITMGKQHLIGLDDFGEVLGIATSSEVVTLLTEKNLLHLQII